MTDIAMTHDTALQSRPIRRSGLWAIVGSVLTVASLGVIWLVWQKWVAGASAEPANQRQFLWLAVSLGTVAAAASGLAIAALNSRDALAGGRIRQLAAGMAKRILLALQIFASLVAASAAAALVFEFKLPR